MKKKIGDTEYTIIPVPPYLSAYSARLSKLLQETPESIEHVEKTTTEAQKLLEKLFDECVKPKPTKEDMMEVWGALINVTNKTIEEAGFFREPKKLNPKKGNATGTTSS